MEGEYGKACCGCSERPEEDVGPLGSGVTGNCVLFSMGPRKGILSSGRTVKRSPC